ncbi:MAG: DUF5796 family protein, partial [Haloferacaceae archaeon]
AMSPREIHVLVPDPSETEGGMLYVNDLKTADAILEDSGVGRIVLDPGDREEVFPGVTVERTGERTAVEADPDVARGRVFVFVEDEWSEESYELVAPPESETESVSGESDEPETGSDGERAADE